MEHLAVLAAAPTSALPADVLKRDGSVTARLPVGAG